MPSKKREVLFDRGRGRFDCLGNGHPAKSSSAELDWRGFVVEHHELPSLEPREIIWMKHVIGVTLKDALGLERWNDRGYVPTPSRAGCISILPAGTHTKNRSSASIETVCVAFDPTFITAACGELLGESDLHLKELYGVEDLFVAGACLALNRETELGGVSGRLYGESMAASLAVHLVSRYTESKPATVPFPGKGLSPRIVRRIFELIEARLAEEISLNELASAAGISLFHFARQFKRSVGLSPHQFVLKQRVERAKKHLMRGELPMSEVALEVGFCDQSHFAMHFKRMAGMTPREFVRQVRSN